MGYALQYQRPLTAEEQRGLEYFGLEDPNRWLEDFDVDIDALLATEEYVRGMAAELEEATALVRGASVDQWAGEAAASYDDCRMGFWDWVLIVIDRILWFIELVVLIVDWIIEIIRWVATFLDWLLGLLSVVGAILLALDHFGINVPRWLRRILEIGKLVEKVPKLILTIVGAAAWVIAQVGWVIDWLLDKLREGIAWLREQIAGCGGFLDPLPDEPIEPAF